MGGFAEYFWYSTGSRSPLMKEVFDLVYRVAPTDASVLISGESGTGKELFARAIHQLSGRAARPFTAVDCGAIPKTDLYLSALFGHVKGAFTNADRSRTGYFKLANTGTMFFDEVGNLSEAAQESLLRALEEKRYLQVGSDIITEFDIRFIAGTNRDLEDMIQAGRFREDLFERLNVFPISIPPLRERTQDVSMIAEYYCDIFSQKYQRRVRLSRQAISLLENYGWPRNVRELMHVIERSIIALDIPRMSDTKDTYEIFPEHIRRFMKQDRSDYSPQETRTATVVEGPKEDLTLSHFREGQLREELSHIVRVLEKSGWKKTLAGKRLGVHYKTVINKLKEAERMGLIDPSRFSE